MSTAATGVAPDLARYALFNDDIELQAYDFDGVDSFTVGNATPVTTLSISDRASVTGMSPNRVAIAGSDPFNNFRLGMYEFDDIGWQLVGNEFQVNGPGFGFTFPGIASMGPNLLALKNATDLRTYEFDGTDWATVGNPLVVTQVIDMATISPTSFIEISPSEAHILIYNWNGSDWAPGANLNIGGLHTAICVLDANHFVVFDRSAGDLTTYQLIAGVLSQQGNAFAIAGQIHDSLCALSPTRIIFGSNSDDTLQAYDWDGANFSAVGNALGGVEIPTSNNLGQMSYLLNSSDKFMDIAFQRSPSGNFQGWAFNGSDFATVGNTIGLPIIGTTNQAFCGMNFTDAAFASGLDNDLRMLRYDGVADWNVVGAVLPLITSNPAISALSETRIALADLTNGLRTYEFDGTDWAIVGNILAGVFAAGNPSTIAALTPTRIAVMNGGAGRIQTYDFDGTDWSATGDFKSATGSRPAITALNSSRIARIDSSTETLIAYDFDGSDWTVTGNGFNVLGALNNISIAAMSSSRVVITDLGNGEVEAYEFDGTDWAQVGNSATGANSVEGSAIASMAYLAIN